MEADTTTPDFSRLLQSIRRCAAVYEPDDAKARAAFSALGCDVLGRWCDDSHQAIAHSDPSGRACLTISGTRVSEGTIAEHFGDLTADADVTPSLVGGFFVAAGPVDGLGALWDWAQPLLAGSASIDVEGHSLGAGRAILSPLFIPRESLGRITAWEPPKWVTQSFWDAHADLDITTVVHGRDPWAAWPWIGTNYVHQPELLWLNEGDYHVIPRDQWSGGNLLCWPDHGPESVLDAVAALAK